VVVRWRAMGGGQWAATWKCSTNTMMISRITVRPSFLEPVTKAENQRRHWARAVQAGNAQTARLIVLLAVAAAAVTLVLWASR
jgi:hypothetical protein